MSTTEHSKWETSGDVKGLSDLWLHPGEDGSSFTATGRLEKGDGEIEIAGLVLDGKIVFRRFTVTSDNITTDTPRVAIGAIRAEIDRRIRQDTEFWDAAGVFLSNAWLELAPAERTSLEAKSKANRQAASEMKAKLGRPPLDDEFLVRVAETYLSLFEENPREIGIAVTEALRVELDKPDLPIGTVKSWINQCRKNGWLAPATKGTAVGKPGPRLLEWEDTQGESG